MGNRSLTPAAVGISHGTLLAVSTSRSFGLVFLTDSAISSSFPSLGFVKFLWCFLRTWLFRADVWIGLDWWLERLELESNAGEVIWVWCCWRGEWDEILSDFPPDVAAFGGAEVIVVSWFDRCFAGQETTEFGSWHPSTCACGEATQSSALDIFARSVDGGTDLSCGYFLDSRVDVDSSPGGGVTSKNWMKEKRLNNQIASPHQRLEVAE